MANIFENIIKILAVPFGISGCAHPDNEISVPNETDTIDVIYTHDTYDEEACIPETCDGLIDYSRKQGDKSLCIYFSEADIGFTSENVHAGIQVADLDGDGYDDVYVLNENSANQLFINLNGKFVDKSKEFHLDIEGYNRSAFFGDHEQDGDLDLLLVGDLGTRLYRNNSGQFDKGVQIDSNPAMAGIMLYADILTATDNGTRFYRNVSANTFEEDALNSGLYDSGAGSAFAVNDYNNDGLDDIYLANFTGKNRFFKNTGNGYYESVEDKLGAEGEFGSSTSATWVTLQPEDISPALYISNWNTANLLYVHLGNGKYENKAADLGLQDAGNTTCAKWADFLNDGYPGLFLCRYNQMNLLYLPRLDVMSYQNIAYPAKMAVETATISAAWLDYDRDGLFDLIVVSEAGITAYHNETHWVKACK